jgi:hypothetical protein
MNIDLDLNNYNLQDILNLFKLPHNYTSHDLKNAYKIALKTHPDKSGLDKEYFLFFTKAFKILKNIYDYTHKDENCSFQQKRVIYQASNISDNTNHSESNKFIQKINKISNTKEFQSKFNDLFNKVKIHDNEQDTGYDKWFKSNEDINNIQATKLNMNSEFERIKSQTKSIIKHTGIQDLERNSGSNLIREKPSEYSSDLFSKLKYNDLKKTYTETVVPVTQDDYYNREKFHSIEQMKMYRKQNESIPEQHITKQRLQEKYNREKTQDVQNAYKMMKQMEDIQNSHNLWMSNFRTLTNE